MRWDLPGVIRHWQARLRIPPVHPWQASSGSAHPPSVEKQVVRHMRLVGLSRAGPHGIRTYRDESNPLFLHSKQVDALFSLRSCIPCSCKGVILTSPPGLLLAIT